MKKMLLRLTAQLRHLDCGGTHSLTKARSYYLYYCYYQERHFEVDIHHLWPFRSPGTISTKLFLQKLWQQQLDWDCATWSTISQNVTLATALHVISSAMWTSATHLRDNNTCFCWCESSGIRTDSVHTFWRTSYYSNIKIQGNSHSHPRLELIVAVVASRLSHLLYHHLKSLHWFDSQVVLSWTFSDKKLKAFVSNRVAEICNTIGSSYQKLVS